MECWIQGCCRMGFRRCISDPEFRVSNAPQKDADALWIRLYVRVHLFLFSSGAFCFSGTDLRGWLHLSFRGPEPYLFCASNYCSSEWKLYICLPNPTKTANYIYHASGPISICHISLLSRIATWLLSDVQMLLYVPRRHLAGGSSSKVCVSCPVGTYNSFIGVIVRAVSYLV